MDAHHDDDLAELLARLPKRSTREMFEEIDAARRADAAAPPPEPTTIPMPTYPYGWSLLRHPRGGTMRFSCPLGCGWHHEEHPARDLAQEPIRLPLDLDQVGHALTARADARAAAFRTRVEGAIAEHFEQAHPGR